MAAAPGISRSVRNDFLRHLRRSCEKFLQWCSAVDGKAELALACGDLYGSLIGVIELGGNFGLHHGEVLVGGSAIPLRNWHQVFPGREPTSGS